MVESSFTHSKRRRLVCVASLLLIISAAALRAVEPERPCRRSPTMRIVSSDAFQAAALWQVNRVRSVLRMMLLNMSVVADAEYLLFWSNFWSQPRMKPGRSRPSFFGKVFERVSL